MTAPEKPTARNGLLPASTTRSVLEDEISVPPARQTGWWILAAGAMLPVLYVLSPPFAVALSHRTGLVSDEAVSWFYAPLTGALGQFPAAQELYHRYLFLVLMQLGHPIIF